MKLIRYVICGVMFLICCWGASAQARTITDMAGRTVTIPDRITHVYASSPPATHLIYAIDPTLVAGLNSPLTKQEQTYLHKTVRSLPVVGNTVGQGKNINIEMLLKAKPDIVLVWAWPQPEINARFERLFSQLKIPTVYVKIDSLRDYPAAFTFMGTLLNRQKRAAQLRAYTDETLRSVDRVVGLLPQTLRPTIYYAEGIDGLATERENSFHVELIKLAGGRNVHRGNALDHYGMERISLEQVLLYEPQYLLVQEDEFFSSVITDPRWRGVPAVKNRRVYRIPRIPFNWFDRPPSFMRLLGLRWLTNRLHPDRFPFEPIKDTRRFYRLFLNVEPNRTELAEILKGS